MFGDPELFDELQVGVFILSLKKFRIGGAHSIDLEWRSCPKMKWYSGSDLVLDDKVVLEGRRLKPGIRLLMEMR